MARKRKDAEPPKRGDVRVSLRISRTEHRQLRALALYRDRTINQVLLDAIAPHLATVRIPYTQGTVAGENADCSVQDGPGRAGSAA